MAVLQQCPVQFSPFNSNFLMTPVKFDNKHTKGWRGRIPELNAMYLFKKKLFMHFIIYRWLSFKFCICVLELEH